jgi:hypothetical protein
MSEENITSPSSRGAHPGGPENIGRSTSTNVSTSRPAEPKAPTFNFAQQVQTICPTTGREAKCKATEKSNHHHSRSIMLITGPQCHDGGPFMERVAAVTVNIAIQ